MREVQRKLGADQAAVAAGGAPANEPDSPNALSNLAMWLERAERIRAQQRNSKNKLAARAGGGMHLQACPEPRRTGQGP